MIELYPMLVDENNKDKCISRCVQKDWYIGSCMCQDCQYNADSDKLGTNFWMTAEYIRCKHPDASKNKPNVPVKYKIEFKKDSQFGINTNECITPCPHPVVVNAIVPNIGSITCQSCRYNVLYHKGDYVKCNHPEAIEIPIINELQLR